MTRRLAVGLLLLPLVMVLGCGGDLPKGAVAQVGQALVSQDQFDALKAARTRRRAALPTRTSSPTNTGAFERGLAEYLVTMEVLRQEAPAFTVTITEQDVQAQVEQIKQFFQGDEKRVRPRRSRSRT